MLYSDTNVLEFVVVKLYAKIGDCRRRPIAGCPLILSIIVGPSFTMSPDTTLPIVVPYGPDDHRYVAASELTSLKTYETVMCPKGPSTIQDFAMSDPRHFLRSTSKWAENHLIAFRCLLLEKLPTSRIVPLSELP